MTYVDGYLLPLAKDKVEAYRKVAQKAGEVWKEHGALAYWETLGDDLVSEQLRSFSDAAKCNENEIPVFAWIIFPSREERDRINAAVMADPRLDNMMNETDPIFDFTRMAFGGFKPLVSIE